MPHWRPGRTNSPRPIKINPFPADIIQILAIAADQRSDQQRQRLREYYRSLDSELARLQAVVQRSEEQLKNKRLIGIQDLAWALINNPAFLFNH